jgi:chemotaxis protein methyltransferase CheR
MLATSVSIPPLTPSEMTAWSKYVHEISGVYLDPGKAYLIQTRLGTLLRSTACTGWTDLLQKIRYDTVGQLRNQLINSITTNETSFFRDITPFELLKHKLIPELIDRRTREGFRKIPIRIFSAACSTGQEIYSTIIMLQELLFDLSAYDILVTGVDISDKAVAQASSGIYSNLEVSRGLSPDKLARFFTTVPQGYKIRDEYRFLASFRKGNLLASMPSPGKFDIVFCRNVGIYFTEDDRRKLFRNMGALLRDDGALIIGSTESLTGLCPELEAKRYLRAVFYQKKTAVSGNAMALAHQTNGTLKLQYQFR